MAAPAQTSASTTPQSVRNSKGYFLRLSQKSERRAVPLLVVDNRAVQRRPADVVRLRADFWHRPEQERAQSIEVLGENAEGRVGGHRRHVRHPLEPDVVVGHQRDVRVTELELPGE